MKSIIAGILVTFLLSSCGNQTNNQILLNIVGKKPVTGEFVGFLVDRTSYYQYPVIINSGSIRIHTNNDLQGKYTEYAFKGTIKDIKFSTFTNNKVYVSFISSFNNLSYLTQLRIENINTENSIPVVHHLFTSSIDLDIEGIALVDCSMLEKSASTICTSRDSLNLYLYNGDGKVTKEHFDEPVYFSDKLGYLYTNGYICQYTFTNKINISRLIKVDTETPLSANVKFYFDKCFDSLPDYLTLKIDQYLYQYYISYNKDNTFKELNLRFKKIVPGIKKIASDRFITCDEGLLFIPSVLVFNKIVIEPELLEEDKNWEIISSSKYNMGNQHNCTVGKWIDDKYIMRYYLEGEVYHFNLGMAQMSPIYTKPQFIIIDYLGENSSFEKSKKSGIVFIFSKKAIYYFSLYDLSKVADSMKIF